MNKNITVRPFDASAHAPGSYGFIGRCAFCGGARLDVPATHDRVMTDKNGKRIVVAVCAKHTGEKS